MIMPKEQGIKIKQPVEGLPQPELTMTLFCHPERSEGSIRDSSVASLPQNDKERRARNDKGGGVGMTRELT